MPRYYDTLFRRTVLIVVAIKLVVFVLFRFYDRWWRYVSIRDMWSAVRGVTAASLVASLTVYFFSPVAQVRLPRSVAIMDWLFLLGLIAGTRLLARSVIERPGTGRLVARGKEVLVVGAGDAGQLTIREMQRNRQLGYTPIGVIDDDPRKKNLRIHGVRVLGTTAELAHILRDNRPDEVLIAIPSASGEVRQRIVTLTREGNVPVKTLPGLYELISGETDLATQIRPVQVEDVLGREPVDVDLEASASYLENQTVLVTGAGGSIGSELCRQIARLGPQRLILVDQGETALFEIERELVDERGFAPSIPVLADVKSRTKMRQVFDRYRPSIVFHAAAYKHVPLMEANPLESVRNNARRDADPRRDRGRVRRRAVPARLDRQGRQPEDRDGPVEGALRVDRRGLRRARGHRDPLRRGALRERARLLGQRDPDLPRARSRTAGRSRSRTRR